MEVRETLQKLLYAKNNKNNKKDFYKQFQKDAKEFHTEDIIPFNKVCR